MDKNPNTTLDKIMPQYAYHMSYNVLLQHSNNMEQKQGVKKKKTKFGHN